MNSIQRHTLSLARKAMGFDEDLSKINDWKSVSDMCGTQEIAGVCFDVLQKDTPQYFKTQEGSRLYTRWLKTALEMERTYSIRLKSLETLSAFLERHGISTLVLKGLCFSGLYPVPSHRHSNDIDIYLFEGEDITKNACDRANALLEERGLKIDYSSAKHSRFHFKGAFYESHRSFFSVGRFSSDKNAESLFNECLAYETLQVEGCESRLYQLSPKPATIFAIKHTARHFNSFKSVNLKQLMDLGLFFSASISNGRQSELKEAFALLKQMGLGRLSNVFVLLSSRVVPFDTGTLQGVDLQSRKVERDSRLIMKDIMSLKHSYSSNRFVYVLFKIWIDITGAWKYAFLPESYFENLRASIGKVLSNSKKR